MIPTSSNVRIRFASARRDPRIQAVRGAREVLGFADVLDEFARRCDQTGAAADLAYFVSKPGVLKRIPILLLFLKETSAPAERPSADDLAGAVLVYEYRVPGISTGMYTSNDRSGRSTLLAPAHRRGWLAAATGAYLLRARAHVVLLSFRAEEATVSDAVPGMGGHLPRSSWATRQRQVPDYLALKPSYDETLSCIGQRTRSNLRYYRRRAQKDLGCTFVPAVEIGTEEVLAFNRTCMYAVSDQTAGWRHRSLNELAEPFLMGLKDRDARWLSLAGGRRVGDRSEILWQMNRDGLSPYSISLVMRGFLIEHEIGRGATRFCVEGGSPHPIRHSFVAGAVTDMAILRRSLPALITQRLAHRLIDEENDLAQLLVDREVQWNSFGRGRSSAANHAAREPELSKARTLRPEAADLQGGSRLP